MSKDLWEQQRETEILAEMNEFTFMQIPPQLRESIKMKRIDEPNWKPVYQEDEKWKQLNKNFVEALKARKQREDEIRAGL